MARNNKIIFMPLGGAQEVGASCYYLKLGKYNFLLDCGAGQINGISFNPYFDALIKMGYVKDLRQISHVFISHAHLDHVAALPEFLQLNDRATAYMTDFTFKIAELQLIDRLTFLMKENISRVSFMQKILLKNLSITFHQAGHIPGAMMTLFNFNGRKILYTGDYSTFATQLVEPAIFPDVEIDVLIICAVHSRHSMYRKNNESEKNILTQIRRSVKKGRKVYCHVNQISKGVELITLINKFLPDTEIFINDSILKIVHCFEDQYISVMTPNNHPLRNFVNKPCVILSTRPPRPRTDTDIVNCNFSLHDDFNSVVKLITRINPKICVVVHSPPDNRRSDTTIEQILLRNPDSRTSFIFPDYCEPFEL